MEPYREIESAPPPLSSVPFDSSTSPFWNFSDINQMRNADLSFWPAWYGDTRNLQIPFGRSPSLRVDLPTTRMTANADVMRAAWSGGLFNLPKLSTPDSSDTSDTSTLEAVHTSKDEDPPHKLTASPVDANLFELSSTPEEPIDDSDDDSDGSDSGDIYAQAAQLFKSLNAKYPDKRERDKISSEIQARRLEEIDQQMKRQKVQSTRSILAEHSNLYHNKRCNKNPRQSRTLQRQNRRRRPRNRRRRLKSIITPADGTPFVVPPKSTKRETKPSPPRSRKPEQASTRFQGREKQASKLNPNAAEFEPSVSVYASIVPGETSFVSAPDGTSLARVFANVFVATNHLNSILTQSFGVLSLNATRLH